MVTGHRHGSEDVCDHEDPLEDAEAGGEHQGRGQGAQAEGHVVQRSKVLVLLQPQGVEVYSSHCRL